MNTHADRLFGSGPRATPCAAAMVALLTAVPVTAPTADLRSDYVLDQLTVKVSLSDLDLTTDRGFQLASERIHQTARRLCNRLADTQDLGHHDAFARCVDGAVASASAGLNALAHRGGASALASSPASR
jgi:UrcA family protein